MTLLPSKSKRRRVGESTKRKVANPLEADYGLRSVLVFLNPFEILAAIPALSKWHREWMQSKAGFAFCKRIVALNFGDNFATTVLPTVRQWLEEKQTRVHCEFHALGADLIHYCIAPFAYGGVFDFGKTKGIQWALTAESVMDNTKCTDFCAVLYAANGRIAAGCLLPLLKRRSLTATVHLLKFVLSVCIDGDELEKWIGIGFPNALRRASDEILDASNWKESLRFVPFWVLDNVLSNAKCTELFTDSTARRLRYALICFDTRSAHWSHWRQIYPLRNGDKNTFSGINDIWHLIEFLKKALFVFVRKLPQTTEVASAYSAKSDQKDNQRMAAVYDSIVQVPNNLMALTSIEERECLKREKRAQLEAWSAELKALCCNVPLISRFFDRFVRKVFRAADNA